MYHGKTARTAAGWPRNHRMVMSQNARLSTAMIGVPARTRLNRMKLRGPMVRSKVRGLRMCTNQVCK